VSRVTFGSILFEGGFPDGNREAPECLDDLNLDQVIDAITAGKEEYELRPLFYTPLPTPDAIAYRHEVMRDLDDKTLFEGFERFVQAMRTRREYMGLAERLGNLYQRERWFLEAVEIYCGAVAGLNAALAGMELQARGLVGLREYVRHYAESAGLLALAAETKAVQAALGTVRYCLAIKENTIKVRRYEEEVDYSAEVEATFARFKEGTARDYRATFASAPEMNHIEYQILNHVALLFPEVFRTLDDYCERNRHYLDTVIGRCEREVQFYLAVLEYMAIFRRRGLPVCYPRVVAAEQEIFCLGGYDMALAYKLCLLEQPVVCNDFDLAGKERIFLVSGPNQGGKTTFARSFGQMHYLAQLGCPVAGSEAQLNLCDAIYTHFESQEDITNLRGKLQDDLVRIHRILKLATPRSIIIINEIFSSTTLQDAVLLGERVMREIVARGLLCVCVTFMDELAGLSATIVSMVSTVDPQQPQVRTYRIVRRPPDGLAYAISIAEKHRLTYAELKERLKP
jgi:DNA mismatch repair protein MutS